MLFSDGVESDVNVSIQSTPTPQKLRGPGWDEIENLLLVEGYLKASRTTKGVHQSAETFQESVRKIFHQKLEHLKNTGKIAIEIYDQGINRPVASLVKHFKQLKAACKAYDDIFKKLLNKNKSGYNEQMVHEEALVIYNEKQLIKPKKNGTQPPFKHMNCWIAFSQDPVALAPNPPPEARPNTTEAKKEEKKRKRSENCETKAVEGNGDQIQSLIAMQAAMMTAKSRRHEDNMAQNMADRAQKLLKNKIDSCKEGLKLAEEENDDTMKTYFRKRLKEFLLQMVDSGQGRGLDDENQGPGLHYGNQGPPGIYYYGNYFQNGVFHNSQ